MTHQRNSGAFFPCVVIIYSSYITLSLFNRYSMKGETSVSGIVVTFHLYLGHKMVKHDWLT